MSNPTRRHLLAGAAAAAALPAFAVPRVQAAAPLAEKQNPGWYRYKVGSSEITVVTDGSTTTPLADNYIGNAAKNEINATLIANHLPPDKVTHAYSPVVVNTGSKLVVIDTGLGLGMYQQSKGAVGQFHNNLAADHAGPRPVRGRPGPRQCPAPGRRPRPGRKLFPEPPGVEIGVVYQRAAGGADPPQGL